MPSSSITVALFFPLSSLVVVSILFILRTRETIVTFLSFHFFPSNALLLHRCRIVLDFKREDPAHNLSEKPFGPEQGTDARRGMNEVQGSKRASSGSSYLDTKEACKDNTSFSEKCCLPEFQKTKLLYPALSADEQKSNGRDTAEQAKEVSHLDCVRDKEDLMITEECNYASHGAHATPRAMLPYQEFILEGPLMNELVPSVTPSPEVVSLVVALSPEACTGLADMNGEAT